MSDNNENGNGPQRPGLPNVPGDGNGVLRGILSVVAMAIVIAYVIFGIRGGYRHNSVDPLATSEFVTAVREDRVKEVTYRVSKGELTGSYWVDKKDVGETSRLRQFSSYYVGSDSLEELMAKHPEVLFDVDTTSSDLLETLLATILPTVIVVVAMLYFMNQIQGQNGRALNFGRAERARTNDDSRPKTKFADVAGIDEAVEAGNGQDAAGQGRCRRGGRAVLLHLGL